MKSNQSAIFIVAAAVWISGCAAATDYKPCANGVGENCVGGSGLADGSVLPDPPDLAAPATPKKPFGEACNDKSQCASDVCLFAGIGGVCTRLCDTNPCPTGFGCYGVLGVIDPGLVAQVCVPDSNQLCTPCIHDTECSLTSHDLCLPSSSGTGDSFCARDCTTVGCPSGYACSDVTPTSGGTTFKQCLPTSGSCDCTAATAGQTRACSLTTALGTVCQGQRSCQGATGWTSCTPPSTSDVPDGEYADENCDGIDGDVTLGIFVAPAGIDNATCGLVYSTPCHTIGFALNRATAIARPNVYVQAGTYNEVVVLQSGKNIYGGYDANWKRGSREQPGHAVTITGGLDAIEGQFLSVRAHDLSAPATLADLVVVGPTPPAVSFGRSTYALHVKSSTVSLKRVTLRAGAGAAGSPGTPGQNAEVLAANALMSGGTGGGADQEIDLCDDSARGAGGPVGTNPTCAANTVGGTGGYGGRMDHDCTCIIGICLCLSTADCRAEDGTAGTNGAQSIASFGVGGAGGTGGDTCSTGQNGQPGRVLNGSAGASAPAGAVMGLYFVTGAGGQGGAGANGGGGGGGGAAGACDNGTIPLQNSSGAGGGGGGAGGCAAVSGGGGGGGGGLSFAVFAVNANVTIADSSVEGGAGAAGSDGGAGGTGQSGGHGGAGGNHNGGAGQNGSIGGVGGHGGHGGGGAGGAGGSAYGLYSVGATYTLTGVVISGGTAGAGGQGGASGIAAPFAERDGNSGPAGPVGATAKCNFNDAACL